MNSDIDVVFFIEHADRELDSVCRIAQVLEGRFGVRSVVLSIFFHAHVLLSTYRAKVFVFPFVMTGREWPVRLVRELYGDSVTYVNMNWEQLLSPVNSQYKRPRVEFPRRSVKQLAWDESFKQYLLGHGVDEANIFVVGNPANAILIEQLGRRQELKAVLSQELNIQNRQTWLFFPMNYAWAFTTDRLIRTRIAAGYDEQIAWEYKKFSRNNLNVFVQWIDQAAKRFEEFLFIVRPHPSVSCEQYREVFQDVVGGVAPNITITKHRSVREWLPTSNAVFSSWSTVAWDAHNAGIPAYLLAPFGRPVWLNVDWNEKITNIRTQQELIETIAGVDPMKSVPLAAGGADSIERHASCFEKILRQRTESAVPLFRRTSLRVLTLLKLTKVVVYGRMFSYPWLGRLVDRQLMYDFFVRRAFDSSSEGQIPKQKTGGCAQV